MEKLKMLPIRPATHKLLRIEAEKRGMKISALGNRILCAFLEQKSFAAKIARGAIIDSKSIAMENNHA